ncbi:Ldh family oxidoreductase [Falsiroseomonas oryzae]|uniref:Ldh family oxidoreductase n=1 Tax=Falsiroseomonas oryzae TaxID=2766473 RepID=UPI0022EB970F|nr:Ldh family oxidoreductase [Roseomonas sp. MO-31]
MADTLLLPAETCRAQIVSVLTAWGMDPATVRVTAEVMVETDLAGVDSHGISMLMDYDESRLKGRLNLQAKPRVVRESPVTALVDADAGLGHPASVMAMELAIAKAKAAGVGVVAVRNSHHFGAAGYYAEMAPKHGLLGLVTSATRTIGVVPTRAAVPVLGTNPIAFAAPAARNRPFRLDMATSTVAANKVRVYGLAGKPLPAGWVLDGKGSPITDGNAGWDIIKNQPEGGLTPVGGTPEMASHKGYGLGMMAHILGGVLSGASFSPIRVRTQRPQDPDNIGHFFMALDPTAFREEGEFEADMDEAIDVLHQTRPADPALPVLVAGDPEAASRERRLREGIPISPSLAEQLRGVCARAGVPCLLP